MDIDKLNTQADMAQALVKRISEALSDGNDNDRKIVLAEAADLLTSIADNVKAGD